MTVAFDLDVPKNFNPYIYQFMEQVCLDLSESDTAGNYLFLTHEKTLSLQLPGKSSVHYTGSGLRWLQKRRLRAILEKNNADLYITFQENGLVVLPHPITTFGTSAQHSLTTRIVFGGLHAMSGNDSRETNERVVFIRPASKYIVETLTWAEAESIKTQYTAGKDFFLVTGDSDNQQQLIDLLKAFSLFKKWQQSNMQLVIAGFRASQTADLREKLSSYKYRQDVIVLKKLPAIEMAKLISASYAILYPSVENVLPVSLVQAIQSGVALAASDTAINHQFTEAAIWVDNSNMQQGFSDAMVQLYKDENKKQLIIQKAKQEALDYSRSSMIALLLEHLKHITG